MTLVLSLHTNDAIWLLTDRRLSDGRGPIRDDACKTMVLETTDGVALLGYAGLGATSQGTQPSDWMSNVLRGRSGTIENALGVLADSVRDKLPEHLRRFPRQFAPTHAIVVPAFVENELRLYTIGLNLDASGIPVVNFRKLNHEIKPNVVKPHMACTAGSGARIVFQQKHTLASIRRLAEAHDKGRISAVAVADELAKLNLFVHQKLTDTTVGPRCIVTWRYRQGGVHQGGGGHQFYSKSVRDSSSSAIPTIANGMDVRALIDAIMPQIKIGKLGDIDENAMNAAPSRLPSTPDDRLL